jgi:hypothetical protein
MKITLFLQALASKRTRRTRKTYSGWGARRWGYRLPAKHTNRLVSIERWH